jgi:hypothetical protein
VGNNPVNRTDPDGEFVIITGLVIGAIAAAVFFGTPQAAQAPAPNEPFIPPPAVDPGGAAVGAVVGAPIGSAVGGVVLVTPILLPWLYVAGCNQNLWAGILLLVGGQGGLGFANRPGAPPPVGGGVVRIIRNPPRP